jgi:hypothetical protein
VQGEVIPFSQQLENFGTVQEVLEKELGVSQAWQIISESIYYISTGSNDFISNYLLPNSPHGQLGPADFKELVRFNFTQQIRVRYIRTYVPRHLTLQTSSMRGKSF